MAHLQWTGPTGQVMWLRFDSVRTVEHRRDAVATSHPVEKGADISDHVRVGMPSVSVTGYVSKAPLFTTSELVGLKDAPRNVGAFRMLDLPKSFGKSTASALQGGVVQAGLNALKGAASPSRFEALVLDDPTSRVAIVTEALDKLMVERQLVRFVDEAKNYENMVLVGVGVTRTQREYGGTFQLELAQIKIVESKLTGMPVPAELRGMVKKAAGMQSPLRPNETEDEKRREQAKSTAAGLFDFVANSIRPASGGGGF